MLAMHRGFALSMIACVGLSMMPAHASDLATMRHELFEERRAIESISHRERIRILQEAEDCIQAATNFREYRACERQESKARKALRARLQPRLRAFRAKMRTYRILHREAGRHPSSLPDER